MKNAIQTVRSLRSLPVIRPPPIGEGPVLARNGKSERVRERRSMVKRVEEIPTIAEAYVTYSKEYQIISNTI